MLPNIANFKVLDSKNVIQSAAHYQPVDFLAVGWTGLYGVFYCGALLALAMAIFSKRDFK
ncbi:MAG: hypothetical protein HY646_21170 [Acidobacteria bacterium]|nr:hypothetical protein [Acidobacteriota bacterium]